MEMKNNVMKAIDKAIGDYFDERIEMIKRFCEIDIKDPVVQIVMSSKIDMIRLFKRNISEIIQLMDECIEEELEKRGI